MSDHLHEAVQAEIASHTVALPPPFDAIRGRKRRRDRGRLAAAAVALAVVGVATASFVVAGPSGRSLEQLAVAPPVGQPVPSAWDGRRGPLPDRPGVRVDCVQAYTAAAIVDRAFAFDGTVTAIGASVTNRPDKGQLDLAGVTFAVNHWYRGGRQDTVIVDLPPPGAPSGEPAPAYDVGSRLLVSGQPRWGGDDPLDQPIAWACGGFTRYYDPETAQAWQDATEPPRATTQTPALEARRGDDPWWLARLPEPTDRTLDVLVHETSCASGRSAEGRVTSTVHYDRDNITVSIRVASDSGFHTCQGNPDTAYQLQLREPIGDRRILDGRTTPAAEAAASRPPGL